MKKARQHNHPYLAYLEDLNRLFLFLLILLISLILIFIRTFYDGQEKPDPCLSLMHGKDYDYKLCDAALTDRDYLARRIEHECRHEEITPSEIKTLCAEPESHASCQEILAGTADVALEIRNLLKLDKTRKIIIPYGTYKFGSRFQLGQGQLIKGQAGENGLTPLFELDPKFNWIGICELVKEKINSEHQRSPLSGEQLKVGGGGIAGLPYAIGIMGDCGGITDLRFDASKIYRASGYKGIIATDDTSDPIPTNSGYRNCDFTDKPWYEALKGKYLPENADWEEKKEEQYGGSPILIRVSTDEQRLELSYHWVKKTTPGGSLSYRLVGRTYNGLSNTKDSGRPVQPIKYINIENVQINKPESEGTPINDKETAKIGGILLGSDLSSCFVRIADFEWYADRNAFIATGISLEPSGWTSNPVCNVQILGNQTDEGWSTHLEGGYAGIVLGGQSGVLIDGVHIRHNMLNALRIGPGDAGIGMGRSFIRNSLMESADDRRLGGVQNALVQIAGRPFNARLGYTVFSNQSPQEPFGVAFTKDWSTQSPLYIQRESKGFIEFENVILRDEDTLSTREGNILFRELVGLNQFDRKTGGSVTGQVVMKNLRFEGGSHAIVSDHILGANYICHEIFDHIRYNGRKEEALKPLLESLTHDGTLYGKARHDLFEANVEGACVTYRAKNGENYFYPFTNVPEMIIQVEKLLSNQDLINAGIFNYLDGMTPKIFKARMKSRDLRHSDYLIDNSHFEGQTGNAIVTAQTKLKVINSNFISAAQNSGKTKDAFIVLGPGTDDSFICDNNFDTSGGRAPTEELQVFSNNFRGLTPDKAEYIPPDLIQPSAGITICND